MKRLKRIHPSWVVHIDTDEFIVYNYIGDHENASHFMHDTDMYHKMTIRERNLTLPLRQNLPVLGNETIAHYLARREFQNRKCLKMPGLQMSARESPLFQVVRDVPSNIDARTLMTLRHRKYGIKQGNFTKCLIHLGRVPKEYLQQQFVRTIHNPLALRQVCGKHGDSFLGMDYISSIVRIHHYAGTVESFNERMHDVRRGRNESFQKRNVKPVGETDDVRPWIQAFVNKVGTKEAQRLLQPLKSAYLNTDWSDVWSNETAAGG